MVRDITEGNGPVLPLTELDPITEEAVLGAVVLGGVGCGGELESSSEISLELISLGRCSSFQGCDCG